MLCTSSKFLYFANSITHDSLRKMCLQSKYIILILIDIKEEIGGLSTAAKFFENWLQ